MFRFKWRIQVIQELRLVDVRVRVTGAKSLERVGRRVMFTEDSYRAEGGGGLVSGKVGSGQKGEKKPKK